MERAVRVRLTAPTGRTSSNDAYAWTQHYNVNRGYSANGLNQYTAAGNITPTYDLRGNLASAGPITYAYTSENLLKSTSDGNTLYYDPLDRLIEYDTTISTRFIYDGGEIAAEIDNPSGAVLRRYVRGADADEPIVWYEGSGVSDRRYLIADERGSIIAVTDNYGNATAINSYDEYGIPQFTNRGRFQYTGQAYLAELGLYYYKARMYSATLGRFMQTDPIGYDDGPNWYSYAKNDPVNLTDPTGECTGSRLYGDGPCGGSGSYIYGSGSCIGNCTAPGAAGQDRRIDDQAIRDREKLTPEKSPPPEKSHPFSLPTTGDGDEIVVTGTKMIRDSVHWVEVGGRYYENPNYNPPLKITLEQAIIVPPLVGISAAIITPVVSFAWAGREIVAASRNWRIAPFGNRKGHPTGRFPHYHRRPSASPPRGQGIDRHRPWDKSPSDRSFWDRF